jgi:hypothetical protein
LSVDETVAYLKRTSQTTALVEGKDDQKVYRYIEERLEDLDLDVLICEGRDGLLAVHRRRHEFAGAPVVFIADRDMWYFTGIPPEYATSVLFTEGYSIENDLYVREVFEALMSQEEQARFKSLVQQLARWQAFHVEQFVKRGSCNCDVHVSQITPEDLLCNEHLTSIGFVEPDAALIMRIVDNYPQALRGKTLFQIVLRILSAKQRSSKFSRDNLIELGAKLSNPVIEGLCQRTRVALTPSAR